MKSALALALFTACYKPADVAPCTTSCATTSDCPAALACTNGRCTNAQGGCTSPTIDAQQMDAPLIDAPPGCFYGHPGGFFASTLFCPQPGSSISLPGSFATDTDTTPCVSMPALSAYCVVMYESVTVGSNATVFAHGSRPLLIVARDLTIGGTLDVSSHVASANPRGPGANDASCPPPVDGMAGLDGGQGGAGGSFGGRGGRGGGIDGVVAPNPQPAQVPPTMLRGGCGGGGGGKISNNPGLGGVGGGAAYLLAGQNITVAGTAIVLAGGGGGGGAAAGGSGGGGGGSGGLIVFDAEAIVGSLTALANGGGGGGGSTLSTAGGTGGEQAMFGAAAVGGIGPAGMNDNGGGKGSLGSSGVDGGPGAPDSVAKIGGGGGGGGAGFIRVFVEQRPDTTHFSPAPM